MEQQKLGSEKIASVIVGNTLFRAIVGDITQQENMDAIVNPANKNLDPYTGEINMCIHKAAGPELFQECKKMEICNEGDTRVTGAYRLPTKYIIHAVYPKWTGGDGIEIQLLERCYINSLLEAVDNNIHTIAFPLIGVDGLLSFPVKTAASIAVKTVADYIKDKSMPIEEVVWVLKDNYSKDCIELELAQLVKKPDEPLSKNTSASLNSTAISEQGLNNKDDLFDALSSSSFLNLKEQLIQDGLIRRQSFSNLYSYNQNKKPITTVGNDNLITAKDFVVRSSTFKCRHNNHSLHDVKAVFTIISPLGAINKIQIAAGFCPNCNMYFIMESTYQRIRRSGIPICRTMDEKTYRHGNKGNISSTYGFLAQESVLKQFGYSANQVDDISPAQRRLILAALIDNGILTKTDIIGYLDYFINIRKGQKNSDGTLKYRMAIGKWKDDRNYIENYKIGSFKAVEIRSIVVNK